MSHVEDRPASAAADGSRAVRSLVTWLIGCAIFVGLPLAAWIPVGIPRFLNEPGRVGYLALVLALNAVAAIRIPEVGQKRPDPVKIIGRQRWAVLLLQLLSLGVVIVAPLCDRMAIAVIGPPAARYVGLVLYAVGFLVMHVAEATLGRQFSLDVAIQKDHQLVTDGVYRFVRHPRYLGIEMFTIGIALVFRSAAGLGLAAAVAVVLAWRIHDEEPLMEQEFGARWRAYVDRTWRLVPWVY